MLEAKQSKKQLSMKRLKSGQVVRLTDETIKWKITHADEIHGFPHLIKDFEQFKNWRMDKEATEIYGVILEPDSGTEKDTHLVWLISEDHMELEWLGTEEMEPL